MFDGAGVPGHLGRALAKNPGPVEHLFSTDFGRRILPEIRALSEIFARASECSLRARDLHVQKVRKNRFVIFRYPISTPFFSIFSFFFLSFGSFSLSTNLGCSQGRSQLRRSGAAFGRAQVEPPP